MERRGFFFVDQAATLSDRSIKLNFIPDGKSKNMSAISSKLDAKEIAGGKGKTEGANRAEAKKLAGGAEEVKAEGEEPATASKKQAKKDAKKAEKAEKKAANKGPGGEEAKEGEAAKVASKGPAQKGAGEKLLKIYNWRVGNAWVDIACITANFAKVGYQEVFNTPEEQKSKEWRAKSLTGKTPTLETPEGQFLNESAAIARYLAEIGEGKLHGASNFEVAQVNQWIDYVQTNFLPHFYPLLMGTYGHGQVEADAFNHAMKEVKEVIMHVNRYLGEGDKTHLVSNRLTVADIYLAVPLVLLFQVCLDGGFRKAVPKVNSWIESFI